jgi:MoxR-like ATPase
MSSAPTCSTRAAASSLCGKGPVFTDILLADEINRTPPENAGRVLEAMQERHVTIDGEPHMLSDIFTVFATQNPIRLRRHLSSARSAARPLRLKVLMTYPSPDEEAALLVRVHRGFNAHQLASVGLQQV